MLEVKYVLVVRDDESMGLARFEFQAIVLRGIVETVPFPFSLPCVNEGEETWMSASQSCHEDSMKQRSCRKH